MIRKQQGTKKKNPGKENGMKNVFAFALSYLYSHSLYLSLEHSSEGLLDVRSYRDNIGCKDGSNLEIGLINDF